MCEVYDLIIRKARIVDGRGNPWFQGDVAVSGGRIAAVGRIDTASASRIIDADGLVVCPGFIDMHSHSDLMLLVEPESLPKIMQGVTTEVLGQDGIAAAPIEPGHVVAWRKFLAGLLGDPPVSWEWRSVGGYLGAIESASPAVNVCMYAPYGNIRLVAMGGAVDRPPAPDEMERILEILNQSFDEGCLGLSTGLIYPPCCYSTAGEMIRVQHELGARGSFLVVHQRSEGSELLESMAELIEVARRGGAPLHLSHLKVAGRSNWHKRDALMASIDDARLGGVDVTFDQYPYTAGSTMLSAILPPWAHDGGADELLKRLADPGQRERIRGEIAHRDTGWENMVKNAGWDGIVVSSVGSEGNQRWVGMTLEAIAAATGKDPADAAMDLMLEESNAVGMITFHMSEENVAALMKHPCHMVCTDGLLGGKPHPRVYGSYPRVLGRYVRERGVLTLEDAIRRMTGFPAQRLGLSDRGNVRAGARADLVVFDPDTIIDRATYDDPRQTPLGIHYVVVNGEVTVENGQYTGARAGRVIRRPGD